MEMSNFNDPLGQPTVKICLIFIDFELWGRTDNKCEYSDHYTGQDCGRPRGSMSHINDPLGQYHSDFCLTLKSEEGRTDTTFEYDCGSAMRIKFSI